MLLNDIKLQICRKFQILLDPLRRSQGTDVGINDSDSCDVSDRHSSEKKSKSATEVRSNISVSTVFILRQ